MFAEEDAALQPLAHEGTFGCGAREALLQLRRCTPCLLRPPVRWRAAHRRRSAEEHPKCKREFKRLVFAPREVRRRFGAVITVCAHAGTDNPLTASAERQPKECALTLRSSGLAPAWHPGREPVLFIISLAARAPRRRSPLSSNVRPHSQMLQQIDRLLSFWLPAAATAILCIVGLSTSSLATLGLALVGAGVTFIGWVTSSNPRRKPSPSIDTQHGAKDK